MSRTRPTALADRGAALFDLAQVLRAAVVGLQSGEPQVSARRDPPRERDGGLPGLDAAAVRADVDLHQHVEPHAEFRARRRIQRVDVARVVHAHGDVRLPRQRRQPGELGRAHDLVGDKDIFHATQHHGLGLGRFLAAHADGPAGDLRERDVRALVALRVRPDLDVRARQRGVQPVEVALERVEIEDERGRVHFGEGHADFGGNIGGHDGFPGYRGFYRFMPS